MIIITIDTLLRLATLLLFFLWVLYWVITENEANLAKPKTIQQTGARTSFFRRWLLRIVEGIVVFQLFGLHIISFSEDLLVPQVVGFCFVVVGVSLAVSARKTLGTNWAHAFEYQVKKQQELVTSGVYAYIRHPIYTGLCLALIGGELVAQSYLFLAFVFLFAAGYKQARQEEKLLIAHFGSTYKNYMKRTKMFLPFLW